MSKQEYCLDCGGAGCKACFQSAKPPLFFPVEPRPYVRTTRNQKFVDERYKKYMDYKDIISQYASIYMSYIEPGKAIVLDLTFKIPMGKNWSKVKKERMEGQPKITTPDTDNYLKAFTDALKGIAWRDDGQVYEVRAKKVYSAVPGIEISIEYFDVEGSK